MENDGPPSLEMVQIWILAKANWDQFQDLCSTRLYQPAIADANEPTSLFTSILKDIADETIPKTSAVPKCFNKAWFADICKDAIKECNRALERFKRKPTEGNPNVYRIVRAKARRDIRHSKKTSWINYVSKMNSQTSVKSVWNRIRKIKGKNTSNTVHHLSVNDRDVTSHHDIANALADNVSHNSSSAFSTHDFLFARKLKSRLYNVHLIMLKYTTVPSLWKSCRMLCVDPMIPHQDQMKYTISYLNICLVLLCCYV